VSPGIEQALAQWLESDFVCDRRGRRFIAAWREEAERKASRAGFRSKSKESRQDSRQQCKSAISIFGSATAPRWRWAHTLDDALAQPKHSRSRNSRELGTAGYFSADVPQMDLQQACAW
jgi:hypothetical protein